MDNNFSSTPKLILRWPEVKRRTGLCRSYVYFLIGKNKFPPPIKLGERASGWLEHEINQWIECRVTESRGHCASAF